MTQLLSLSVFYLLCGTLLVASELNETDAYSEFYTSSLDFSMELFETTLRNTPGNVVISPASMAIALSMIQQGARKESLSQLTQLLKSNGDHSRKRYGTFSRSLKRKLQQETLEVANGAFLNRKFDVLPEFRRAMNESFEPYVDTVDFSKPEQASQEINYWISRNTNFKINELVNPEHLTKYASFFVTPQQEVKVPMMQLQAPLKTGVLGNLNSRWVELPFELERFSMLVILPNEKDGLNRLLNAMAVSDLSNVLNNYLDFTTSENVSLSFPKLKLETDTNFVPILKQLGVTDIFSDKADLSGISSEALSVSDLIHTAQIEVDETGTKASASSGKIGKKREIGLL
ncbi:hypothetical protein C0J52_13493 [Blattella germanica]|nr:hypothetical protein C0J52_13493 [Blattella germanica]